MEDVNSNMDEVFRDKLEDYRQQPPEEIWDGIRSGMGNSRRKILIPLWQAAAGAAILVTAGSLFYYLNQNSQNRIAEQLFIVPQNVQTNTHPRISASSETQSEKIAAGNSTKKVEFKSKENNRDQIKRKVETLTEPEKSVIAKQLSDEIYADKNSISEFSDFFSLALMSDAYISPVPPDKIPGKNKTLTASWDMLDIYSEIPDEEDESYEHLLLTAQVSPTYSYRDIGKSGEYGSQQFDQNETGRISYSGGLQFGYKTSQRLSIYAGVMYAQLGYNINQVESFNSNAIAPATDVLQASEELISVYTVNNSIGDFNLGAEKDFTIETKNRQNQDKGAYPAITTVMPPIINQGGKIEQYFQYLELPFLIRYKIIDRKLGVNLLGGVSTNILVGNHASITIDNETSKIGSSENVKNLNYMGNLGLGFDYILRKNLYFTVEPQFKYFLNSINQSSLVNRPYMLGMFTGVRFMW